MVMELIGSLYGRDLIVTQEWSLEELRGVLKLAKEMKKDRFGERFTSLLKNKTFFMFFYNPSVRTRQSFECAATELGGHAQFLEPKTMRLKSKEKAGETVQDAAKVMSRYACGIGIRILEDSIEYYGQGDELLREYAKWADVPIISMAHDKYHPCQGLADIMGMMERFGTEDLRGKKVVIHWAKGALVRSWSSVQEALLIYSRFGMDVTLAFPEGYDLDPQVIKWTEENAQSWGARFEITHDLKKAYKGAHVVYSRNWMSPKRYERSKEEEIREAMKYYDWICTKELMGLTEDALFIHPMPIDRGAEVTDEVADSPNSIIYDVAENRLHVQKAIMAMTMVERR